MEPGQTVPLEGAASQAQSASSIGDSSDQPPNAAAVCGVCEINPPKYKCPRCYMPYCSVACNRVHRENHPADPKPELPATRTTAPPENPDKLHSAQKGDPLNPFSGLDSSDHLQHLFRKYPGLARQLQDIYAATQPPTNAPENRIPASLMQGMVKKDGWNHDIGIKNGKEALRKARQADGQDGEAIREYTELVLHLINKQNGQVNTTTIVQQNAQEDSKLIEQLMAQERR